MFALLFFELSEDGLLTYAEFCKLVKQFAYSIVNLLLECGDLSFYFFLELRRKICGKVKETGYLAGNVAVGRFWGICCLFFCEVFIQKVGYRNGEVGAYFFQNGAFGDSLLCEVAGERYFVDAETVSNFTVEQPCFVN